MKTYYKALGDFRDWFNGTWTREGELLTPRERHSKYRYLSDDKFKEVAIAPRSTCFVCGRRYAHG